MSIVLRDFDKVIEGLAPKELKEDYDNVGLMVGSMDAPIKNIMVALDCTKEVISEAVNKDCSLIFTHHPMLFKPLKNIDKDSLIGSMVYKLIEANINLYSAHTNLDKTSQGINDLLVDILFPGKLQSKAIEGVEGSGIGRIVLLDKSIPLSELIQNIKKELEIPVLRYCGDLNTNINKVAVINGSGEDYINEALSKGADCIITGDTSYHPINDAKEKNIPIIDAGHFKTEWKAFTLFAKLLESKLKYLDPEIKLYISSVSEDPYKYI